jgi:NAD(P)-dependent dehydrogenase (short-subunit alcohol dehydrogenase family)
MASAVLVTGGTGLLGARLVRRLLQQGTRVAFTTRKRAHAESLLESLPSAERDRALVIEADLAADGAALRIAEATRAAGMRVDGLVNNARNVEYLRADAEGRVARADFAGELLVDVIAAYELTMAFAGPGSELASVVNVSSIYGVVAPHLTLYDQPEQESFVHYGVAKAALIHLTKELAVRLAPRGVRVNAVSFGGVAGRADDEFVRRYARECPAGRMLAEEDVAGPIEFLLSFASAGMTGHNLLVDGGWTQW